MLASAVLCAVLVAGRPAPPRLSSAPALQIQAPFQISAGNDDPHFHLQNQTHQIEHLSSLDAQNTPHLEISSFSLDDGLPALDSIGDEPAAAESLADQRPSVAPLTVLAFSCLAALLALACIVLTLYIIKSIRSRMLASKMAWASLPRFWKRSSPPQVARAKTKPQLLAGGGLLLLDVEQGSPEGHGLHTQHKPLHFDAVSDLESESDDIDEKYQDALDTTPIARIHDLPRDDIAACPSSVGDPPLPHAVFHSLPDPTTAFGRSSPLLLMPELCPPLSRPAWSVRAIDAPMLGLSTRESDGLASTPDLPSIVHPHRRAYRAIPEFDIALAMQLRPGLGIGADAAWMVRFLMTIFGWFAVALTGTRPRDHRR